MRPILRHLAIGRSICSAAALLLSGALIGCSGGQQDASSQQGGLQIRQSVDTAPADLQLICASEAAKRLGVDQSRVLPVRSEPSGNGYRVVLNAGGAETGCLIDNAGTVISIG